MEYTFKKHFSVDEANELLPQLVAKLARIDRSRDGLDKFPDEVRAIHKAAGGNGGGEASGEILEHSGEVAKQIDEIVALGVIMRDLDSGLFDFPYLREEREVFLCWKRGEKKIGFWHELDKNCKNRQSL